MDSDAGAAYPGKDHADTDSVCDTSAQNVNTAIENFGVLELKAQSALSGIILGSRVTEYVVVGSVVGEKPGPG